LVDGEDGFYLYHPEITETVSMHGEQIGSIGNYNTDGWKFNLPLAFKQTLYVLMAEPLSHPKYLFFITDRLIDLTAIEKALYLNKKEMIDAHFILIGIGSNYDHQKLSSLKNENVTFLHFDDVNDFEINRLIGNNNGKNDL
jgi:hypothetical protein